MSNNAKRCQNAKDILGKMKPTIAKAVKSANDAIVSSMAQEYVSNVCKIEPRKLATTSDKDMVRHLEKALSEAILQMDSLNKALYSDKVPEKPPVSSFYMQMADVERKVIKIQSKMRQQLAIKTLEKKNDMEKARLARRHDEFKGMSNEEKALREFSTQVQRKGLTPEGFFRSCDADYQKTVSIDTFKKHVDALKRKLTKGQVSRLALILDEDMEGNISLEEYNNALEAYGIAAEHHIADSDGVGFEHKSVFKLIDILQERGISYQELFSMCDVSGDGIISVRELAQVLMGLSPEFYMKEIRAIHNFFDIDRNDRCTEQEYTQAFFKAEQLYQRSRGRNPNMGQTNNSFMRASLPQFNNFNNQPNGYNTMANNQTSPQQ